MRVKVSRTGAVVVLRLSGRLTLEEVPWLGQTIEENGGPGIRGIVLNMVDITDLSSSGIGKLLQIKKDCELKGKRLLLADISPVTEYVLDLARLTDMFEIFKTEADALAALPQHSSPGKPAAP